MKPVIILAKGPSARFLSPSNQYDVATINNAIWMHTSPKWSFFNDVESMEQMEDNDFKEVKNIIVPSFLHSQHNPKIQSFKGIKNINQNFSHVHWTKLNEIFPNRYNHVNFNIYELHPGDNQEFNEQAPRLDEWPMTTTQTATLWLLKYEGIRDIIIAGADPGKGYHQLFIDRAKYNEDGTPAFNGQSTAAQPVGVYQKCWDQGIKWANYYGARIRHINDILDDELINLGID
jgi:hypothetical protein|tara:strand:+ start:3912 stop:4607 length:696 start_codon:yes stop_codon:yes gene_type:complete